MVQLNNLDLQFILKQIKIAEANSIAHSGQFAADLKSIWTDDAGNTFKLDAQGFVIDSTGTQVLVGGEPQTPADLVLTQAISADHVPYGLRTVDGSFNNLGDGRQLWGAADQPFIRLLEQGWRVSDGDTFQVVTGATPLGQPILTTIEGGYGPAGPVADADPRLISNLIVDQTLANPAAIYTALAASGYTGDIMSAVNAIRAEFNAALDIAKTENDLLPANQQKTVAVLAAEVTEGLSAGLEADYGLTFDGPSLYLPNVAPDEGLSAPYNSWFTLFGQFFDHGLDLVAKGGNEKIYIPLQPDDPLYVEGSRTNYMTLTRSPLEPSNLTTPFIDQNQTYSSTASKQLFLREYAIVDGKPVATGHLLEGAKGIATWGEVKEQARIILGIDLTDEFVGAVPMFKMDAYGEFVRGPNGYPQLVTAIGLVEGDPDQPISLANAVLTGHAFLDDIAHNAVPGLVDDDRNPATPMILKAADADDVAGNAIPLNPFGQADTYDDELLDAHFVTGDGRGNENIGLTAVHHIFHSEHNGTVEQIKERAIAAAQSGDFAFLNEWLATDVTALPAGNLETVKASLIWDGERLFQGARFTTEMQYQHLVFEEFARKIQPDVDAFVFNPSLDIDPSIFAEFAHVVYRFGHSMLDETVDSVAADGTQSSMDLFDAFLNPLAFAPNTITAEQGAGAIIRGMTGQVGNEIDEYVTDVLRNHLVGIPLDLPALNIARGREAGIPGLNAARAQFKEVANGDTQLDPYKNWIDYGLNLKNPASIVNFIAAYGTHGTLAAATTLDEKREAAMKLVFGDASLNETDRQDFLNGRGAYQSDLGGLNDVDLWVGGLAEKKMAFGGMLGSTFSFVFELQLENLQNGDRFYYLSRTQGLNLLNELEANSFAELVIRNTDIGETGYAVPGDVFSSPDHTLYVDAAEQAKWGYTDPVGDNPFQNALAPIVERGDHFIKYNGLDHLLVQGTNEADTIIAGGGDDSVWGRGGNDVIEAGYGVDKIHGGEGDDIITNAGTDIGEVDFLMGEEGDDVIHGGSGLALVFGNQGSDVLIAGPDGKELFGGEGNDFLLGGDGGDFLLGNEGDDWMEGGNGFDTLAGDNSDLFFNSPIIGHDVMFAGQNEQDFDAESGDDIMVQGESVMRNEGMWGYDWSIYKGNTKNADGDLLTPIFTTDQQDILRNRFDAVEGLSGWDKNDVLRGDDRSTAFPTSVPADPEAAAGPPLAGAEATMVKHHLSQAGIDRIAGLRELLADLVTNTPTVGADAREAEIAFDAGNIILGGGGSDTIQGRGGDDLIDGDHWLNVRIRITHSTGILSADSLAGPVYRESDVVEGKIVAGAVPVFAGRILSELLLDRSIAPSDMEIVREVVDGGRTGDVDTAVFWDVSANYTVTSNEDGSVTVTHVTQTPGGIDVATGGAAASDGIDRLLNIERLQFADRTVTLNPPTVALDGFNTATRTFADNFDVRSASNNTGGTAFNTGWVEAGDGNGLVTTGAIQIDQGDTNQLRFNAGTPNGATITRALNLAGSTSANISFTVDDVLISATSDVVLGIQVGNDDERLEFQFASDGVNFVTLATFDGNNGGPQNIALPAGSGFGANAAIRFRMVGSPDAGLINERFSVDNLVVTGIAQEVITPAIRDLASTFTENQAAISVGSEPLVTDDSGVLASARIVLTNASAGDALAFGTLPGGITGAVATVGGTIVVTLTGSASVADYQTAIQAVSFTNTSDTPSATPRVIEVTVNDGLLDSAPATHTVTVVPVNDAPVANDDAIRTNISGIFTLPDWVLLANDTDADGNPLSIAAATSNGGAGFTVAHAAGATATTINYTNAAARNLTYTATDGAASDTATVSVTRSITGTGNADIIVADGAASAITAGAGNDIIFSGAGNDTVSGQAGDDIMVWNAGDGRDRFIGGANATAAGDLIRIEGDASNEAFVVYSRAAALANGIAGLAATTEIVITRNGAVALELEGVEEILINTGGGVNSVTTLGDFAPTSLNFNTITVNGSTGDDTVDITGLASAHRVVFKSNGGHDTVVGTLRPQDVVELPAGSNPADYVRTFNTTTGLSTITSGTNMIVFAGDFTPILGVADGGDVVQGAFTLTQRDVDGMERLVDGLRPFPGNDDADAGLGVRDISGAGNNTANPAIGNADEAFIRLTEAHYGAFDPTTNNRALNPIFDGLDARAISDILGDQEAGLPKAANGSNIFLMTFGQYFDHGLSFIPKSAANGTVQIGAPGSGAPGSGNPADLTRGEVVGYDADGLPLHRNTTTAFVDQNQAYGSHVLVTQLLRQGDGNGGLTAELLKGAADPSADGKNLLPTLQEAIRHHWANNTLFTFEDGTKIAFRTYFTNYPVADGVTGTLIGADDAFDPQVLSKFISNFMGSGQPLLLDTNPFINVLDHYLAGDGRANENFGLTAMHTIWARNHNFHVENLRAAGFEGSEQELFEAAKIINEGEYQRVVFQEFADVLIGGIQGVGDHGHAGYNDTADAGISHEFAAAVYRFGHSMIGQTLTVIDENGQSRQVDLFDAFLNPSNDGAVFTQPLDQLAQFGYVPQPGYAQLGVDAILGGQVIQPSEEVDFNIVDAVRDNLVRINADLFSFNVARGRDVGLGTLNQVRSDLAASQNGYVKEAVGYAGNLSAYTSWEDFQTRNGLSNAVIAQFRQAYPDLVLDTAEKVAAFVAVNPDLTLLDVVRNAGGTIVSARVQGIDRVDLWVGGLAEKHINGGMVGQTFWVVLQEQFDRLQEADRFYYKERLEAFDFYDAFIDGGSFSDIIARNTGLQGLPEDIFLVDNEDNQTGGNTGNNGNTGNTGGDDNSNGENPDDTTGNGNGSGTGSDGNTGGNTDNPDDGEDPDDDATTGSGNGDGSSSGDGTDDEDDTDEDTGGDTGGDSDGDDDGTPDSDNDNGTGSGTGTGTGTGGGTTPLPVAAISLIGTAANDVLTGAGGNDVLIGGDGTDVLSGDAGDDILRGDGGDDVLIGGAGADVLQGGAGADEVHGGAGADLVFGGDSDDLLFGDDGNDIIEGGAGKERVWAGRGDDTILATANDGDDVYNGDEGIDTLDYSVNSGNLVVDLGNGFAGRGSVSGGTTGADTFYGFENFISGAGHDVITASNKVNIMDGGLGNDVFKFGSAETADGDTIYGFQTGDRIDFSGVASGLHLTAGTTLTGIGDVTVSHEVREGEEFTVIRGKTDGDDGADFELALHGRHNLSSSDFVGVA